MTVGPEDPGPKRRRDINGSKDAEASAILWPAPRAFIPPQSAVRVRHARIWAWGATTRVATEAPSSERPRPLDRMSLR